MEREVTAEMSIADAIAADAGVIERLAALHAHFHKLRNPLLRKTLARLVTFGDAARIAGLPVETLIAAAQGRKVTGPGRPASKLSPVPPPVWLKSAEFDGAARLDVRPMLAAGAEPLGDVMRLATRVPIGGLLIVEAPFDPAPLRRVLGAKGFASHAEPLADEHWRIYFLREDAGRTQPQVRGEAKVWREADGIHIDVRGLEAPRPMVAILALVDDPVTRPPVVVHHEREPLFLYPELAERGWRHAIVAGAPGEVRLILTRAAA